VERIETESAQKRKNGHRDRRRGRWKIGGRDLSKVSKMTRMEPIQSLWIGQRLSTMERLAISSFQRQGHEFHLYVYDRPAGVPEGTILLDANLVLPASKIFKHRESGTYAPFSSRFRWELLYERGGWWVDLDVICLKPFQFQAEYVFGGEWFQGRMHATNCVMRAERHSPVIGYALEECRKADAQSLPWATIGPKLLVRAVDRFGLTEFVHKPAVFCPVAPSQWDSVLNPSVRFAFAEETCAVHLYQDLWRRANRNKDAQFPRDCLYERLKHQVLGAERQGALGDFFTRLRFAVELRTEALGRKREQRKPEETATTD
jgi:hypothetical protein